MYHPRDDVSDVHYPTPLCGRAECHQDSGPQRPFRTPRGLTAQFAPLASTTATLTGRTQVGRVFSEVKTPSSRRQIALTSLAVDALRRHRARQLEQRLVRGAARGEQDLVFPHTHGAPMEAANFRRLSFDPLIERAGLPSIRFHDLRQTAARLMLQQHVPTKVVSEMLGHRSVSITSDLYSHVLPGMQSDAARTMGVFMAKLLRDQSVLGDTAK